MDGKTFVADYQCCLENGPRISCRIQEDKELMARKLPDSPGFSCAGRSIQEIIAGELDSLIDNLMLENEGRHEWSDEEERKDTVRGWRGQAQGLAIALAIIRNPYLPNVIAIKAEAMERRMDGLTPEEFVGADEILLEKLRTVQGDAPDYGSLLLSILEALVEFLPEKIATAVKLAASL